jgi:hypothetical protein
LLADVETATGLDDPDYIVPYAGLGSSPSVRAAIRFAANAA